jgi:hypothetical protein
VSAATLPARALDMVPCAVCSREVRRDEVLTLAEPREAAIGGGGALCGPPCLRAAMAAEMRKIDCTVCGERIDPHGEAGVPGFVTPAKRYCSDACKKVWAEGIRRAETRIARGEIPGRPGFGASVEDYDKAEHAIVRATREIENWQAVLRGEKDGALGVERGTAASDMAAQRAASLLGRLWEAARVAADDRRQALNARRAEGTDEDRAAYAARAAERKAVTDAVAALDHGGKL